MKLAYGLILITALSHGTVEQQRINVKTNVIKDLTCSLTTTMQTNWHHFSDSPVNVAATTLALGANLSSALQQTNSDVMQFSVVFDGTVTNNATHSKAFIVSLLTDIHSHQDVTSVVASDGVSGQTVLTFAVDLSAQVANEDATFDPNCANSDSDDNTVIIVITCLSVLAGIGIVGLIVYYAFFSTGEYSEVAPVI